MRPGMVVGGTVATVVLGTGILCSALQTPAVRSVDEKVLREFTGVYRWDPDAFVYLQMASLRRFVPAYFTTIHDWLAKRIRGFGA